MAAQSGNAKSTTKATAGDVPATTEGQDPRLTPEAQEANREAVQKQRDVKAGEANDLVIEAERADGQPLTTLDNDVSHPGVVSPGDTPFDTVLTAEHASSVTPDKATAGREGYGVVNAVVPIPDPSGTQQARALRQQEQAEAEHRVEKYEGIAPNGQRVQVEHNLDTGETKVLD